VNRVDVWGLEVQVCKRPPENKYLRRTGLDHYWIKTDTTEYGIGNGQIPGQNGNSDMPYSQIQWVDHSGQSDRLDAHCDPVPNVDEECVNRNIRVGTEAGWWAPSMNDCRTNPTEVFDYCRTDVE